MKSVLLLIAISFSQLANAQTLFTYGKHAVSKDEFLRAFNKNLVADTGNREQALEEYLDLYIKFKLKVQAAKDRKLDTLPLLQGELRNFRSQIEYSYLKDDKEVKALIEEAATRQKTDVHTLHFFAPINSKTPPADSLKMYKGILELYEKLSKGDKDYDEMVSEVKKEQSSVSGSDLGFITAFTLPYEFENIIYNLKPGAVSKPYRSKKGWHIFKNVEERPAVGRVQVSQILFTYPPDNNILRNNAKKLADSVYRAVSAGADFAEMARQYSNDRLSFTNGGALPEFGIGKYEGAFENAAFGLEKKGDVSPPFETQFGFHILKLIARKPITDIKMSDEAYAMLRQQVLDDKRIEAAREKFMSQILLKTGFKKNKAVNDKMLWQISDSSLVQGRLLKAGALHGQTMLFYFNDNSRVTVEDWVNYLKNETQATASRTGDEYTRVFKQFIDERATGNYRKRLETFSPEFSMQLADFREGNMLFEIMNENVWTKASEDTTGLKAYFEGHPGKYKWERSASAILFSCANKALADSAITHLEKGIGWRVIVEQNTGQMQADSGRYDLAQIPVFERTNFTEGLVTAPVTNENDGTTVFAKIISIFPQGQPRNFADARGIIVNDYQAVLEKEWVAKLEKKYPVSVNKPVFRSLL